MLKENQKCNHNLGFTIDRRNIVQVRSVSVFLILLQNCIKMSLKKYLGILAFSILTSCGLSDALEGINCIAEHNDPGILSAYSDALVALTNNPENPILCQEFEVAIDNYIVERIAYAACLRDSGVGETEDIEEIEQQIEELKASQGEKRC